MQADINFFITERVRKGEYVYNQTEQGKLISKEIEKLIINIKTELPLDLQNILEDLMYKIDLREFSVMEYIYLQGIKEGKIIYKLLL